MKTLTDKQRERKDLLLILTNRQQIRKGLLLAIANMEGKSLIDIIRKYREKYPSCSLGQAIDELYEANVIKATDRVTFFKGIKV